MYFFAGFLLMAALASHLVRYVVIRGIIVSIEDGTIRNYDRDVLKFLVVGLRNVRNACALLGIGLLITKIIWS